jgi:hypothetical protein
LFYKRIRRRRKKRGLFLFLAMSTPTDSNGVDRLSSAKDGLEQLSKYQQHCYR